jgi:hypothetical protein
VWLEVFAGESKVFCSTVKLKDTKVGRWRSGKGLRTFW